MGASCGRGPPNRVPGPPNHGATVAAGVQKTTFPHGPMAPQRDSEVPRSECVRHQSAVCTAPTAPQDAWWLNETLSMQWRHLFFWSRLRPRLGWSPSAEGLRPSDRLHNRVPGPGARKMNEQHFQRPPRTGPVFCCLLLWRRAAERAPARRAAGFAGRVNPWSVNPGSVCRLRGQWPGWAAGPYGTDLRREIRAIFSAAVSTIARCGRGAPRAEDFSAGRSQTKVPPPQQPTHPWR